MRWAKPGGLREQISAYMLALDQPDDDTWTPCNHGPLVQAANRVLEAWDADNEGQLAEAITRLDLAMAALR